MKTCIICNKKSAPLYKGILKCPDCSHGFADHCLTDEELAKLYNKNYFFGDEYSNYFADKNVLEKNFKLRMKILNRFLQKGIHTSLLEIGCAYGFFLNLVKNQFSVCKGLDICPDGIDHAKTKLGLDVQQGDFLNQNFGNALFDVICLWDTIEHLRNPHLYIEKISSLTRKGGLIALTTGDLDSLNAKIRKEKWRLIHPPTHLHYFTKKSIQKLLNNNGFDIVYSSYCGFYRSIDNIAYNILVLRKKNKSLYDFLKKAGLFSMDLYLNLFDIMLVVGIKR